MEFEVGQMVRLLNKPDPAWFDVTLMDVQPAFLAAPLDNVFLHRIKKKNLRIGANGSVGEIIAVDPKTRMLHIKFKETELENVPFGCCVVVPPHKPADSLPSEVDLPLIEPDEDD